MERSKEHEKLNIAGEIPLLFIQPNHPEIILKKPFMFYTLFAAEGREDETIKYSQLTDLVLTVNIAARIHKDDKPRNAVRLCARAVEARMTHPQVKAIINNMCSPITTPDPVAFATALMRSMREAESTIRRRMIKDGVISAID